jgi:predicted PurR-regulated permease PerM
MNQSTSHNFFFGLLLALIGLALFMFLPFLTPVVLAAAASVIFGKPHRYIVSKFFAEKERSSGAALVTLILIVVIVLVPTLLVAGKIYSEVQTMYAFLTDEAGRSQIITSLNTVTQAVSERFFNLYPAYTFDSLNVTEFIKSGLKLVFTNLDSVFTSIFNIAMGAFVMLLALFYFLRDGRELKRQLIALSPLGDENDERILRKMAQAVYSVFMGSIVVAIIQGILTGLGFTIFGIPSPALWGAVASVAALIPGVGTSLILVPGILYLFFMGETASAVGLLVWGLLAVGLIDNFLGPIFVNRGIKVHPFLVLLSVLGGLSLFGPIGLVLGPIVLAFLFALLDIYRTSYGRRQS